MFVHLKIIRCTEGRLLFKQSPFKGEFVSFVLANKLTLYSKCKSNAEKREKDTKVNCWQTINRKETFTIALDGETATLGNA